jgi:hypothetical protein
LQEEFQAIGKTQPVRIAPVRQRLALKELHSHILAPAGIDSRIVETFDLRMLEARQDVALSREALREVPPQLPTARSGVMPSATRLAGENLAAVRLGKCTRDFVGLLPLEHHHIRIVAVGNLHGDRQSLQIG